jgi:murein DD-endopeptidase MepM/ murein hydrolase activator NlpD
MVLAAAIVLSAASCSTDSERFRGPSRSSDGRPVGDLTGTTAEIPAPAPAINASTLPPPQSTQPVAAPLPPPAGQMSANAPSAPAQQAAGASAASGSNSLPKHQVVSGDTLRKIARRYQVPVTELAAANKILPKAKLRMGDQLVIPPRPMQMASTPAPNWSAGSLNPNAAAPVNNARKIAPTPDLSAEKKANSATALMFRWPVRGRIISGFGPKPGGQENAGINFAVPEGTPVKAAEEGVVVYASNELKTYGNLVLIRHTNGFVTAYAHVSEILVKRDDVVKRGQVIAKSGQTGNVATPQLHFEIRKGSTPVDPMPYLDRSPAA